MMALNFKRKGCRDVLGQVMDIQVFKLAKMKGNLQQTLLFNGNRAVQPLTAILRLAASIWTPDCSCRSPLCFRKAASKSRSLKRSLF